MIKQNHQKIKSWNAFRDKDEVIIRFDSVYFAQRFMIWLNSEEWNPKWKDFSKSKVGVK